MVRETPVFPGEPKVELTSVAASTTGEFTVFSSDADNSQVITQINYYQDGANAETVDIKINDGSASYTLARVTTSAAQGSTNLLKNTYIPIIDDSDPRLYLDSGQSLILDFITGTANKKKVYVAGGVFA